MLDEDSPIDRAIALVAESRLFDEQWYAATAGCASADRATLVAHWVRQQAPDASPHPLFEPAWLYPAGRWRHQAPDPLSFYLSRSGRGGADGGGRSPHPSYPQQELGALEDWLGDHDPADLLPQQVPRAAPATTLVVVPTDDLVLAVRWLRHLARVSPAVTGLARPESPAATRVLTAVAATLPSVRVVDPDEADPPHDVRVEIDPGLAPPRWPWLPDLLAALDRPGVAAAQALLLTEEFTVAGPLLAGHPLGDVLRLDGRALPARLPGVRAARVGVTGDAVLATASRMVAAQRPPAQGSEDAVWRPLLAAAGFDAPGRPSEIREGRRALRWSIDIAAGAGPIGTKWGDFHFATSLADALDRLGQWVTLDHPETRGRASRDLDDVSLTIRGLEPVVPPSEQASLLWVISHPDGVTPEEVAAHDVVFAASTTWAAERSDAWGREIHPLLQCTDTTRFHPGVVGDPGAPRLLFVANARHELRRSVAAALRCDVPLTVYGSGWEEWLPSGSVTVAGERVANTDLPAMYAGAGVVLNDHWSDMAADGFVSNRIFDVLATGGRLLTDEVAGLADVPGLGGPHGVAVPTWRDDADFARLADPAAAEHPDDDVRRSLAERVVAEHGFDARAATLLDAALTLVGSRR